MAQTIPPTRMPNPMTDSSGKGLLPLGKTRPPNADCAAGFTIVNLTEAAAPATGAPFASTSCTETECGPGAMPVKSCEVDVVVTGSWVSSCTRKFGDPAWAIVGLVI